MQSVYAIAEAGGPIKIGISNDAVRRMKSLQTARPQKLDVVYAVRVPDARRVEIGVHRRLSSLRSRGEWFNITRDVAIGAIDEEIVDLGIAGEVVLAPISDRDLALMSLDNHLSNCLRVDRLTPGAFAAACGVELVKIEALIEGRYMPTLREAALMVRVKPGWLSLRSLVAMSCPDIAWRELY